MIKLSEFFKDHFGDLSSKRLGLIVSLFTAVSTTLITVAGFLYKHEYKLIVEIINSVWLTCFGFAGVVASEFFKKPGVNKDESNN